MKLTRKDWLQLDELLSKIGFGGYYDFLEVLKQIATNMVNLKIPDFERRERAKRLIIEEKEIKELITFISRLSHYEENKNAKNG